MLGPLQQNQIGSAIVNLLKSSCKMTGFATILVFVNSRSCKNEHFSHSSRISDVGVVTVQPDLAFVQTLRGANLSQSDRSTLEADHLFLLALREIIELTPAEKKKLSPDHILVLALGGVVTLTSEDKKSLPVDHLFMLALRGVAHLTAEDKQRLPSDDLTHLQMRNRLA